MRWLRGLVFGGLLAALIAAPAFAQDQGVPVIVTASMIQSDDEYEQSNGSLPYISITVPADFVLFTVAMETGTAAADERRRELERTFANLADRVKRTQGVSVEVGSPGESAPIETAAAHEAIVFNRERSIINVVLKFAVKPGDTFTDVRKRAEAFIAAIPPAGRVELVTGDNQFIGLNDSRKHREALLRKIADDTHLIQSIFNGQPADATQGLRGVSLIGLGGRVKTRPVGPLEIEMFIPYAIVVGEPLPQPPPRQ